MLFQLVLTRTVHSWNARTETKSRRQMRLVQLCLLVSTILSWWTHVEGLVSHSFPLPGTLLLNDDPSSMSKASRTSTGPLQSLQIQHRRQSCRLHLCAEKDGASNNNNNNNKVEYSDDFFGLLFLGAALALNDFYFGAVFLGLSFVAATTIRQQRASNNDEAIKLPGTVAMASWGIATVLKLVVPTDSLTLPDVLASSGGGSAILDPSTATLTEAVACAASFAYTHFYLVREQS